MCAGYGTRQLLLDCDKEHNLRPEKNTTSTVYRATCIPCESEYQSLKTQASSWRIGQDEPGKGMSLATRQEIPPVEAPDDRNT